MAQLFPMGNVLSSSMAAARHCWYMLLITCASHRQTDNTLYIEQMEGLLVPVICKTIEKAALNIIHITSCQ